MPRNRKRKNSKDSMGRKRRYGTSRSGIGFMRKFAGQPGVTRGKRKRKR